jgi:HTH-type transcriptional regulator/antitoxin MqsA
MQEFKKCPICGKGQLSKKKITETFNYKGRTITIPDYVIYECNVCGEAIVDRETLKSSGKILKEFKRQVEGLLTPDEIKNIRKKFGLSQEKMGEILGGGKKSFARYETGQLCQSRAMDNLLRILDAYPFVLQLLLDRKKTISTEKKYVNIEDFELKRAYKIAADKNLKLKYDFEGEELAV